jgi:tRNA(adenine34) deaminase
MTEQDRIWMEEALAEARLAAEAGEVPVGAVIVCDGKLLARAHNLRETEQSATKHAELLAVEEACRKLGRWRLTGCTLYVTLEPCPMCGGALLNARVGRVVFGVKDPVAGACGSVLNLNRYPFVHHFRQEEGVCREDCADVLQTFFKERRQAQKKQLTMERSSAIMEGAEDAIFD